MSRWSPGRSNCAIPPVRPSSGWESARDMLHRVEAALPADIAIFAAAVADWRVANEGEQKLKRPPPACRRCNWSKTPTFSRRSRS